MANGIDWDTLAAKSGGYASALLTIVLAVLAIPSLAEDRTIRLLIGAALGVAAVVALISGLRLRRRGEPTEGAARSVFGLLAVGAAAWFLGALPSPRALEPASVSGQLNRVIRTAAGQPPRQGLSKQVDWQVTNEGGEAGRVKDDLAQALQTLGETRAVDDGARRVGAVAAVSSRAGSVAGGQVTARVRVALATADAPQCEFVVSTPRPLPQDAAVERLADEILNRTQTYVEGSDAC